MVAFLSRKKIFEYYLNFCFTFPESDFVLYSVLFSSVQDLSVKLANSSDMNSSIENAIPFFL